MRIISSSDVEPLSEGALLEQEMLHKELLREKAANDALEENRRIAILTKVGLDLMHCNPVKITEEMKSFGIDRQVWRMIQEAELRYKLLLAFKKGDDDDYGDGDDTSPFGL